MCVLLHYQGAEDTVEYWKEKATSLTVDRDAEREERNYFQLERDKINTFWEISKKELEDRKAELRNKDRELEELEAQPEAGRRYLWIDMFCASQNLLAGRYRDEALTVEYKDTPVDHPRCAPARRPECCPTRA